MLRRTVNSSGLLGSPCRTAILAPAGKTAGAGPHVSLGFCAARAEGRIAARATSFSERIESPWVAPDDTGVRGGKSRETADKPRRPAEPRTKIPRSEERRVGK